MVYITGDIHGDTRRIKNLCEEYQLTVEDTVVILGDVGANYYLDERDCRMKQDLSNLEPAILCIHGNHEARPETIAGYIEKKWNCGTVFYQLEYPNLLFAKDGEIFDLGGNMCLVIGGAYSVDKFYRQARGWAWWPDEQPSLEVKQLVEERIKTKKIDVILSHTCPAKYIPTECFLPAVDQSAVDQSTEKWLDQIEESTDYKAWFCGHWHTNKRIDKMLFLFQGIERLCYEKINTHDVVPSS